MTDGDFDPFAQVGVINWGVSEGNKSGSLIWDFGSLIAVSLLTWSLPWSRQITTTNTTYLYIDVYDETGSYVNLATLAGNGTGLKLWSGIAVPNSKISKVRIRYEYSNAGVGMGVWGNFEGRRITAYA